MRNHRNLCLLVLGLVLLALESGCVATYSYDDTWVKVRDAESGEPIKGAKVSINYMTYFMPNRPEAATATTGPEGLAYVRTASLSKFWSVSAPGYLDNREGWTENIQPAASGNVEFSLYRGPVPSATVVVPAGYRGLLRVQTHAVKKSAAETPGKRAFEFRANANGDVQIERGPMLQRAEARNFQVVDENGTPIARGNKDADAVTLRSIAEVDERELFVIGTAADEQAVHEKIYQHEDCGCALDQQKFQAVFEGR